MSKFVSKENLEYIIPKLAKAEEIPAIKLSSMNSENPIVLRDLDSNVYVLHGYFKPYASSDVLMAAQTPIQACIAKSSDASYVQLFFPYNNMVQYFEITDSSYTEKSLSLSELATTSDLAKVATSGSYNDLTNKPTIPTVNNGKLTIQKNGASVGTFTANQSSASTINITVPTGAAADKGVVTSVDTSANLPTSNAVKTFVEGKGYVTSSGSVASATKATQDGNGKNIADTYATNVKVNGLIDRLDTTGVKQITDTTILLAGLTTGIHKLANSATVSTGNKSITCEAGTIIIAQRTDATAVNGIIYRPAYEHRFLAWINSSYGDDYLELSYVADLKRGYIDGNPIATYPIGTIIQTDGSYEPAERFGGEWDLILDRVLIGAGNLYAVGAKGGEATHTLTNAELPARNQNFFTGSGSAGWSAPIASNGQSNGVFSMTINMTNGAGESHNNMMPYQAVCIWVRTA